MIEGLRRFLLELRELRFGESGEVLDGGWRMNLGLERGKGLAKGVEEQSKI